MPSTIPRLEARQSADAIARGIVLGQIYSAGAVYVAGFGEPADRPWPPRVELLPLDGATAPVGSAAFTRAAALELDAPFYAGRLLRRDGADASSQHLFATIDGMEIQERQLALFASSQRIGASFAVLGWDLRRPLIDIDRGEAERLRRPTAAEREQIAAERRGQPADIDCTTEPKYLDDARIVLTARVAETRWSIRLSRYSTPGCLGHLADVYVLDVFEPGREPVRFEFRHYVGLL